MAQKRTIAPKPPYVGAILRLGLVTVRQRLLTALLRHGYKDISASQLTAFSYPFPDGLKPTELAARANQSKQATNYMLADLEDRGYVVRKAERRGGRRRVFLSAKGKKVVEICQLEMLALQHEWSRRVGKERFETFLDVLRSMPTED
jgi:DNA-binding MarR family transcriptional regulator